MARASARSSGSVIFMFRRSPARTGSECRPPPGLRERWGRPAGPERRDRRPAISRARARPAFGRSRPPRRVQRVAVLVIEELGVRHRRRGCSMESLPLPGLVGPSRARRTDARRRAAAAREPMSARTSLRVVWLRLSPPAITSTRSPATSACALARSALGTATMIWSAIPRKRAIDRSRRVCPARTTNALGPCPRRLPLPAA